jgi:hypothetical protein
MSTALDTNVILGLWNPDDALNAQAHAALERAVQRGGLLISAPVFVELLAFPGRTESFVDSFCRETGIAVDWVLEEPIWRTAGRAFQGYVRRRFGRARNAPKRVLTDFLIGAHALHRDCSLLTFDDRLYRAAFPQLRIVTA